jgi:hypothetical protein
VRKAWEQIMSDNYDWKVKSYSWVGPQMMTANGLELHAVVAEDQRGNFHAGTRYGPKGGGMPELGPQDFWCMETYKAKDEAIFAAKTDATGTMRDCNRHARTEALLERGTIPSKETKKPSRSHLHLIDR